MTTGAWFVVIVALSLGGMVKGATGMGLPIIAIPILALYLGVPQAVAIIAVPVIVTNCWQTYGLRRHLGAVTFLGPMLLSGALGIAIGTFVIYAAPKELLSGLLAILLAAYIAMRLHSPDAALRPETGVRLAPAIGVTAGILQGSTGVSSPVLVPFLHALRLPRQTHIAAVSAAFLALGAVQLPALWFAGLLTWQVFVLGVLALVPTLVFMPVGAWLGALTSQKTFDRGILLLLGATAVQLAWQAAGGGGH